MSNRFRLSATSGLVAGVAANGVVFAWRNPSAYRSGKLQRLLYLAIKARTVSGFTAPQEVAVAAHVVSSFVAASAYTGGTDLSNPASNPGYLCCSQPINNDFNYAALPTKSILGAGDVSISSGAALTHAGSPTIQSQPFSWDTFSELAAASTTQRGLCDLIYAPRRDGDHHLDFGANAGFIVRLPVALGAGGTMRFQVEVVWSEL